MARLIYHNYGGKVSKSGRVTYPKGSKAPRSHREKVQAHMDYSYGRGGKDYRDTGAGRAYQKEYDRLSSTRPGEPTWSSTGGRPPSGYSSSRGVGSGRGVSDYYSRAQRRAEEAQRARTQAALGQVQGRIPGYQREAEEAQRQVRTAAEIQRRDLPQQLAYSGKSGGASETSLMDIGAREEEFVNEIRRKLSRDIEENKRIQDQIRATGDASLADIQSQYAQRIADYSAQLQQYEKQRQDRLADVASQRQWEESQADKAYRRSLARASGSGRATGRATGDLSAKDAYKAYTEGLDTPEIRAAILPVYGDIFGTAAQPATPQVAGPYRDDASQDAWVRNLINSWRSMGLSDSEIAARLNQMG